MCHVLYSRMYEMKGTGDLTGDHRGEYVELSWQKMKKRNRNAEIQRYKKVERIGDFTSLTNIKVQNMFLEAQA